MYCQFLPEKFQRIISTILVLAFVLGSSPLALPTVASAAINQQINYQGKLTTTGNVAVPNGNYSVRFKLYTVASGGSPIWTEGWCYSPDGGTTCNGTGTDGRIAVSSGLFSTLLGSTTPFTGVDFAQTLYLGVEIGGSSASSSWDGEMTPRKKLGAVPAAIEALNLGGASTTQYVRTDIASTITASAASSALVINQTGAGSVFSLQKSGAAFFTAGNTGLIGIGTSTPAARLDVYGLAGTSDIFTLSSSSNARILTVTSTGRLGIGTSTPSQLLDVYGSVKFGTSSRALFFADSASGNVGIGSSTPLAKLSIVGDDQPNTAAPANAALDVLGGLGGGSAGSGGPIYLRGGLGNGSGTGGLVYLQSGAGGSSSGAGGALTLISGAGGAGSASGGLLSLTGGTGGSGGGGTGGTVTIQGGTSGSGGSSPTGGIVNIVGGTGGAGGGAGPGGNVYIYGGSPSSGTTYGNVILGRTSAGVNQGFIGVGTSTPVSKLDVYGTPGSSDIFAISSSSNARLLTLTGAGRLGIGSSSPLSLLSVQGQSGINPFTISSSTGTKLFEINQAGGVGINNDFGTQGYVLQSQGANGAATWVATSSLGISGGAALSGGSNGFVTRWTSPTTVGTGKFVDSGTFAGVNATSSSYTFNVQGNPGVNPFAVASSSGATLFRILANGNVGLTSTTPTHLLDLGDAYINSNGSASFAGGNTTIDNTGFLTLNNFGINLTSVTDGSITGPGGAYSLGPDGLAFFNSVNAPTGIIDTIETYGIGGVGSPGNPFTVGNWSMNGDTFSNIAGLVETGTITTPFYYVGSSAGNNDFINAPAIHTIGINLNNLETARFTANGLGLGTTSPVAQLDVYGKAGTADIFRISSSSGSRFVTVSSLGNVGIGSSTPTAKLSVTGTGTTILANFTNTSIGDGNGLNIYSKVDPLNGSYAATYISPSMDNHQINFGEAGNRPYAVGFNVKNAVNLIYENGASWAITAADSGKLNIGAAGGSFWQAQYGASGQTPTNLFQNVVSTVGISLASRAVASQTGDLQQWQNASGTALSVVNVNGQFGIGTSSPSATLDVYGRPGSTDIFAVSSSSNARLFTVSATGNTAVAGTFSTGGIAALDALIVTQNTSLSGGLYVGTTLDQVGAASFGSTLRIGTSTAQSKLSVYGDLLLEGTSRYLNFGNATGTNAYGIRDLAGTMQFKNSGGAWTGFGSGGGSGNSAFTIGSGKIFNATSTDLVGIGTSSPLAKLDVYGTAGSSDIFRVSSSSNSRFFSITSAGNVGITSTTPTHLLDLGEAFVNSNGSASFSGGRTLISTDGGGNSKLTLGDSSGAPAIELYGTGEIRAYSLVGQGGPGSSVFVGNWNFIDDDVSNGAGLITAAKLGIGVAPVAPIDVYSYELTNIGVQRLVNVGSSSYVPIATFLAPNLTSGQQAFLAVGTDPSAKNWGGMGFTYIGNGSDNNRIDFNFHSTAPVISLLAAGKVGIGTTTPAAKLDVYGLAGSNDVFAVSSSSNARLFTITSQGFIGIGTTTPRAELDIYANNGVGASPSILLGGNNGGDTDFFLTRYSNNDSIDNDRFDIGRSFGVGSSSILTLTSTKNIGVGTTSPLAKLDVYGTAGTSDIFALSSSSNSRVFTVSSAGFVGIGTSTPAFALDIAVASSGTSTLLRLQNNVAAATSSQSRLLFGANRVTGGMTDIAGISAIITNVGNTTYTSDLAFFTASSTALSEGARLTAVGNFGIASTTPLARLSVSGASSGTGGAPNVVDVLGGTGGNNGAGGGVFMRGGIGGSSSGLGGAVGIYAGAGGSGGQGGAVTLQSGFGGSGGGNAGTLNLLGGNGNTGAAGQGGGIVMLAGTGGNSGGGAAGIITIQGGLGGSGSGAVVGGAVSILGGTGGSGTGNGGNGGNVYIFGGSPNAGKAYGNVILGYTSTSSQGLVGIGIPTPAYLFDVGSSSAGTFTLGRFQNTITAATSSAAQLVFGANRVTGGMTDLAGISGIATNVGSATYTGALVFSTANASAISERARFDHLGQLGIGTTSPSAKLDIYGIAGTSDIFAISSSSNTRILTVNSYGIGIGTTTPGAQFAIAGVNGSTAQIFDISSSSGLSYLHVMANGNVGIGSSSPYAKLSITGDLAITGGIYDSSGTKGASGTILQATAAGTLWVATSTLGITGPTGPQGAPGSGNTTFNIGNGTIYNSTSTDLVGIGTTSPIATLSVKGKPGANPFLVASSTDAVLLAVASNGNLGLGTSTPSERLHVTGGNILIDSKVDTTGTWTTRSTSAGTIASGGTASIASTTAMAVYNGSLYVGTTKSNAAEIYRFDGATSNWSKVSSTTAGAIGGGATSATNIDGIASMAVYNGALYVGTAEPSAAEVYRFNGGTNWTKVSNATAGAVGGNSTSTGISSISAMTVHGGNLYVGTTKTSAAEVLRYNGDGLLASSTWTKVSALPNSTVFGATAANSVDALASFQGYLMAGVSRSNGAALYRYDGQTTAGTGMTAINTVGTFSGTDARGAASTVTALDFFRSMTVFNGRLYLGVDDGNTRFGSVFKWDGSLTAGGIFQLISSTTAGVIAEDAGSQTGIGRVSSMTAYKGQLYVSTDNSSSTAEVYRLDTGSTWTKVSNSTAGTIQTSGTASINGVTSMTVFNDELWVGTSKATSAEAYSYSYTEGESYALKFHATSDANTSTSTADLNGFLNTGTIQFLAEQNAYNNTGSQSTGQFVFSNGISTNAGAYDLAEDYATRDDTITLGDLVSIDTNERTMVKKSTGKNDKNVIGIFSTNPALRLSQKDSLIDGARAIPVALAGRVPVKISLENGPIEIGDYLTLSSIPGAAMKATRPGRVIGRALSAYDETTVGSSTVTVFISFGSATIDDLHLASAQTDEITSDQTELTSSEQFNKDLKKGIEDIAIAVINKLDNLSSFMANNVTALMASVGELFTKTFTLLPGGSINVPKGDNQIAGAGAIEEGKIEVFIANESIDDSSLVTLTATSLTEYPLYVAEIKPGEGFTVKMAKPSQTKVTFNWFFIKTYTPPGEEVTSLNDMSTTTPLVTPTPNDTALTTPTVVPPAEVTLDEEATSSSGADPEVEPTPTPTPSSNLTQVDSVVIDDYVDTGKPETVLGGGESTPAILTTPESVVPEVAPPADAPSE